MVEKNKLNFMNYVEITYILLCVFKYINYNSSNFSFRLDLFC